MIGKSLILNGLVFFTTYAPTDEDCSSGGKGWLYILEYRCKGFENNFFPITNAFGHSVTNLMTGGTTPQLFGTRVDLGAGMPTRAVPDSTGQNIMIQKSDSTIVRIGVNTGDPGRAQFRGWRAR